MNRDEIFDAVCEIITDIAEIDRGEIFPESSMMDDLSLSSMEVLSIISEAEDRFSMKIPEKDLRDFITVSDLVEYAAKNG